MARIEHKRFVPNTAEVVAGAEPMSKVEILKALTAYKLQNPVKYEAKKAALFARYGLDASDEPEEQAPDANDVELEKATAKAAKEAKATAKAAKEAKATAKTK